MKKISVMIVVLLFLSSSFIYASNDVPSKWAQDSISELQALNQLRERSFTDYGSDITRGEFIYLAVRLYEIFTNEEIVVKEGLSFTDTKDIYTLKGATVGITTGVGNNEFGYNNLLTREQLATLMMRVLNLLQINVAEQSLEKFVDDAQISDWAKKAIYQARSNHILSGIGGNRVDPQGKASKEVALVILNRLLQEKNNSVATKLDGVQVTISINLYVDRRKEKTTVEIGNLSKSVVKIYATNYDGTYSTGSGFFYTSGEVGTNYHVIAGAKRITLEYEDGSSYTGEVKVLGYDVDKDLAALSILTTSIESLTLGQSTMVRKGESIYTIGSPEGLINTLSSGIVSSIRDGFIQISAPISHGSSGGVLLNKYGEVIGITSAGILEGENLGFCIPIDDFKQLNKTGVFSLNEVAIANGLLVETTAQVETIDYNNGDRYVGATVNGVREGEGFYVWVDGSYYVGSWKNGEREGFGELFFQTGIFHSGYWENSYAHGFGVRTYVDGAKYSGNFQYGSRWGFGIMTYPDGSTYEGDWVEDEYHGYGILRLVEGITYEGGFEHDLMSDFGIITFSDGYTLRGLSIKGKRHGIWIGRNIYGETWEEEYSYGILIQ